MSEKPHHIILDRYTSKVHIEEHFADTMKLVREIANYGSNLIPRCYVSSDRKIIDVVIIGALLKHALTMLDAIEILVSQGAVFAAFVQLRSLFETRLYIAWILKEDTDRRSKQYFVYHKRDEILWVKRSIPGTPEHQKFHGACKELLSDKAVISEEEAKAQLEDIERILDGKDLREVNAEFDRLKVPDKNFDKSWYTPWGPSSISDMANRLALDGEYIMFYSMLSKATHGEAFSQHVFIDGKTLHFGSIRNLENIGMVLNLCITYAITIYQMILEKYRPGELDAFRRKYIKEWRSRFQNISEVKYNYTDRNIT